MKQKGFRIYWQFFCANLALLLLPFLLCAGFFFYLSHIAEKQVLEKINLNVERSRDLFDLKQQKLQTNLISRLILDSGTTSALSRSYQPNSPDMIRLMRSSSALKQLVSTETELLDLAIVSVEQDVIVSSAVALTDLTLFYQSNYSSLESEEAWQKRYFDQAVPGKFLSDLAKGDLYSKGERIISYVQYVPPYLSGHVGFWIWVRWREESFFNLVTYPLGAEDRFYVRSAQGELLTAQTGGAALEDGLSNDPIREGCWVGKENGKKWIYSQRFSRETGLLYGAAVDYAGAMSDLNGTRLTLLMLGCTLIGISLLLCGLLARRNTAPLQSIVSKLDKESPQKATYHGAMTTIEEALRVGTENQKEVQIQRGRLRGMMVEKFLHNGLLEEEILDEELFGNRFEENGGIGVLLIRFSFPFPPGGSPESAPDTTFALVGKYLEDLLTENAFIHYSDRHTLTLILKLDGENPQERLESLAGAIREYLKNTQGISYRIALGEPGFSVRDVPILYHQALQAMQYAAFEELEFSRFQDLPQPENRRIFSSAFEMKLINSISAGNAESAEEILSEFTAGLSPIPQVRLLQREALVIAVYRTLDGIDRTLLCEETLGKAQRLLQLSPGDKGDSIPDILKICQDIALDIAKNKTTRGVFLRQRMQNLMDEHYADPQFCIQDMLDALKLSATTFQTVFKEQMGCSFYKFLEELRMRKACRMLLETAAPITEIAEQAGYSSPASFRRAFKKIYNISPADYREVSRRN